MSYNIEISTFFEKEIKKLSKKYPSIKSDFKCFLDSLKENPLQGVFLGNNCYKIRIAIESKGKGKSSGARIITHILVEKETVYLLSIYDKSEQISISDKKILEILKTINIS